MQTLDCGHEPTKMEEGSLGTGVAHNVDGTTSCYNCATQWIKDSAVAHGKTWAYVSSDGKRIITWNGDFLGGILSRNVSGYKAYYRAKLWDGTLWYGQGPSESGTYVSLRRYKNQ